MSRGYPNAPLYGTGIINVAGGGIVNTQILNSRDPPANLNILSQGVIAIWNIALPDNPFDGQFIGIGCPGGEVSSINVTANISIEGTSLTNGNSSTFCLYEYSMAEDKWIVLYNTSGGSGGGGSSVTFQNLAAIEAATIPNVINSIISLAYSTPGDLRGDVMQLIRVASMPTFPGFVQSADGAFWQLDMNEVNVFMFGAYGVGDSLHDDWPAINAAIQYCNNKVTVPAGDGYGIPPTLVFPPATGYYSSQTIAITTPMNIIGSDLGEGHPSIPIQFPVGVTGLTVAYVFAVGTRLKGLCLVGVIDKTLAHSIAHGFLINAPIQAENCAALTFSGCGWYINGRSGGTPFGFTDLSTFHHCTSNSNGRHGFWNIGADANVCKFEQCSAKDNGGWGYKDEGKYTNTYDTCHSAGNGWPASAAIVSDSLGPSCSYIGVVYTALPQDALTGTPATATTTPGTDGGTVWLVTSAAPGGYFTAYVPGGIYRDGGDYYNPGNTMVYINCYSESGAGMSQLNGASLAVGGQWG